MAELASKAQLRASFFRWALLCVPAVLLLGVLSAEFSGSGPGDAWFDALRKPGLYPPPIVFPLAWSVLYIMMGTALAIICSAWGARGRNAAIAAFGVQMVLNVAWSPVFFGLHRIGWALAVVIAMDVAVLVTLIAFWRIRRAAGWLLVPYLAWVLFATALTWQVLALNPQADGRSEGAAAARIEL